MLKTWKLLRGYKRQAGAVVMSLTVLLPLFGVDVSPDVLKAIGTLGTIIFGVGWLDKGAQVIKKGVTK